ncbi:MAG: methylated-DNA--[protein]-cysteine S-methyltransferase [Magnetococcales bacterium]|nr:methylated-DNA--[protein]-cysteine S-methyltransferase [Magnetococcales bacterium]
MKTHSDGKKPTGGVAGRPSFCETLEPVAAATRQPRPALLQPLVSPDFAAIHTCDGAVTRLLWGPHQEQEAPPAADPVLLVRVRMWLRDYFGGHCRPPDFPLFWHGSPFQQRLGAQLATIAAGETLTYGEMARRLGSGPRAVGQALACNPLPLLLPCHRVVAARGLGGYSGPGGVATKQWLLAWEADPEQHPTAQLGALLPTMPYLR